MDALSAAAANLARDGAMASSSNGLALRPQIPLAPTIHWFSGDGSRRHAEQLNRFAVLGVPVVPNARSEVNQRDGGVVFTLGKFLSIALHSSAIFC